MNGNEIFLAVVLEKKSTYYFFFDVTVYFRGHTVIFALRTHPRGLNTNSVQFICVLQFSSLKLLICLFV